MRQRQKRQPVANSGVQRFLADRKGDRERCIKSLTYIKRGGGQWDDLDLLRDLAEEFPEVPEHGWLHKQIRKLEGNP